jgi:hypothetical protein
MTDPLRLTQLRADMEFAELESRIVVAQEKAAMAQRNTKLLDLESLTLDLKSRSPHGSSASSPPRAASARSAGRPHSHMLAGDLPGGFMALLQTIQDNAQAQQQRADELAERQEACHEAQMAALSAAHLIPASLGPATTNVSTDFKSNLCFKAMASFTGENGQTLWPWFN